VGRTTFRREEALYEHPAVLEAAVIGIKHSEPGEEIGAAVALKPGATAEPGELRDFVKARLAAYESISARTRSSPASSPTLAAARMSRVAGRCAAQGPTGKILRREVRPPAAG